MNNTLQPSTPLKKMALLPRTLGLGSMPQPATLLHSSDVANRRSLTNRRSRSTPASRVSQATPRAVPGGRVFVYRLSAAGRTFSGNTAFPSSNTVYGFPTNFQLPGALVVEPTLRSQNAGQNGVNGREVTFIIGNDLTLSTAGTLRYSTHTWGHRHWGGRTTGRPALDTALVNVNNRANTLTAAVDQRWSRNDTTNTFVRASGLRPAPKQILAGNLTIRFTNGGRTVSGTVTLFGNGFIEPGSAAYTARFSGSLMR